MLVCPRDLIHAAKHGVVVIPREIVRHVADAAREVEYSEKPMIVGCNLPDPIEDLDRLSRVLTLP